MIAAPIGRAFDDGDSKVTLNVTIWTQQTQYKRKMVLQLLFMKTILNVCFAKGFNILLDQSARSHYMPSIINCS